MSARRRLIVLCLVMAPVALLAQAPADGQAPPFRTGITYIEVDVFVTDRDGAFVRNLSRDDFELFDDGVRQEVVSLDLVDLALPSVRRPRIAEDPGTRTGGAAMRDERIYALLLDSRPAWSDASGPKPVALEDVRRIKALAHRFIDEALGPDDRMSVWFVRHGRIPLQELLMEHHPVRSAILVQELTNSRPLLRSAIEAFDPENLRHSDWLTSRNSVRPLPASYLALQETAEALGRLTGRRKALLWIGGHVPFHHDDPKAPAELALAYRDAIRAATRHNVAVYPVDPTGLTTQVSVIPVGGGGTLRRPELERLAALRAVAEDTGGIAVVNTNNYAERFARIVEDNSVYYLLGYYPSVQHTDGRFHEITVKVARPGVRVRARRGYFAGESLSSPAVPGPAMLSAAEMSVRALGEGDLRRPLHLRTMTWTPEAEGTSAALWIVGELSAEARRERAAGVESTAEITLADASGTDVLSEQVRLSASDSAFVLRIPADRDIPPGDYTVRVRLRAGDATHTELQRVRIADSPSPLGEAMLWRRGPSTGRRHATTADPRFRRSEELRLELPTLSDLHATARLLDRTGAPLDVPLQVSQRPDGELTWVVVHVPLGPLAPADYIVEVVQDDARRMTAFRIVP